MKIRGRCFRFPLDRERNRHTAECPIINRAKEPEPIRVVIQNHGSPSAVTSGTSPHGRSLIEIDSRIKNHPVPRDFYPCPESYHTWPTEFTFPDTQNPLCSRKRSTGAISCGALTRSISGRGSRSLLKEVYGKKRGSPEGRDRCWKPFFSGTGAGYPPETEILLRTGVFHLFAISGAHIGIIALSTMFILKQNPYEDPKTVYHPYHCPVFFLMLTGFKISAQRAVLMADSDFGLEDPLSEIRHHQYHVLFRPDSPSSNPSVLPRSRFYSHFPDHRRDNIGKTDLFRTSAGSVYERTAAANLNASVCSIPLSLSFFMRYSFTGLFAGPDSLPCHSDNERLSSP